MNYSKARPVGSLLAIAAAIAASPVSVGQTLVSFATDDGGRIFADHYDGGEHGVVLVHGGRYDRSSWLNEALVLAAAGFLVLSIDLRGYGPSTGPGDDDPLSAPLHEDILAGVRYLRANGARTVSVVGASMGGGAAGDAAVAAQNDAIDRLVILASPPTLHAEDPAGVKGRKLFIVARDDPDARGRPRLETIRARYDLVPEPKRLIVLEGAAHAQALFQTDQRDRLLAEILEFLAAP